MGVFDRGDQLRECGARFALKAHFSEVVQRTLLGIFGSRVCLNFVYISRNALTCMDASSQSRQGK